MLLRVKNVVPAINRRCFAVAADRAAPLFIERLNGTRKGVVQLKLNRPAAKNAISKALLESLRSAVKTLKNDPDIRVVIISGTVPGAFCSGADLKERRTMPVSEVPVFVDGIRALTNEVAALPMPVIAAIDGYALGGGLELALACDMRYSTVSSKLGLVETRLAIIPGAGGTQRLSRVVGVARAKELIFTARVISGTQAAAIGLVSEAVDAESSVPRALAVADEILKTGPIATKLAKVAIDHGSQTDLARGLSIEKQCYAGVVTTKDRVEALNAFNEKRPPVFKGE